ncbi:MULTISPECIES: hypothetical protein [Sutcliffiella]|uniref:Prolipoprotein diacylglyceryl transferase n=1 Tax=Sutcliffiella cohnii TaxID=33932 RepID=A0A223KL11_9BACI|nr:MULTISPECIES: hypothetical protein [Sutcliffiella]AST90047.1 hypothetical protein BC6307_01490 [Sutcliffiella cohnii]WBL15675.1 hypothetical protein O1A01_03225 [Sutcliffiella sp. NC1]
MEEFLIIGSIRLPIKWIFIGGALVVAYLAMNIRLSRLNLDKKPLLDTVFNALFYGFIVWKLSYVLFNPVHAFAYPLGILYFDGGQKGMLLGILICFIYIYFQSTKQSIGIVTYVNLTFSGWLAGSATYFIYLFHTNYFYYSGQIFLAGWLLFVMSKNKEVDLGKELSNSLLIYSLGQIFLGYLTQIKPVIFGFTNLQIGFILLALLMLIVQKWKRGEKNR